MSNGNADPLGSTLIVSLPLDSGEAMKKRTIIFLLVAALVSASAFGTALAYAKDGADDPVGHVGGGQGADDPAGDPRGGQGADDPAGHERSERRHRSHRRHCSRRARHSRKAHRSRRSRCTRHARHARHGRGADDRVKG
jgi:hypothetical protein